MFTFEQPDIDVAHRHLVSATQHARVASNFEGALARVARLARWRAPPAPTRAEFAARISFAEMRLVGAVRPLHLQKARTGEGDSSPGSRSGWAVPHAAMAPPSRRAISSISLLAVRGWGGRRGGERESQPSAVGRCCWSWTRGSRHWSAREWLPALPAVPPTLL